MVNSSESGEGEADAEDAAESRVSVVAKSRVIFFIASNLRRGEIDHKGVTVPEVSTIYSILKQKSL